MLIERLAQMYVHWGSPGQTGETAKRKRDQAVAAIHQFLDVIESTAEDRKALFTQSQQSRRKATKLAYLLLASETESAAIHDAFCAQDCFLKGSAAINRKRCYGSRGPRQSLAAFIPILPF